MIARRRPQVAARLHRASPAIRVVVRSLAPAALALGIACLNQIGAARPAVPPVGQTVHAGPELDYQPSIIRLQPSGRLLLVFERLALPRLSGDLWAVESADEGRSWTAPRAVVDSDLNERHPALVQLGAESLALFYLVDESGTGAYRIHRATSSDGAEWRDQGSIDLGWPTTGEINPSVIAEADGSLTMAYHRLSGPSFVARSTDGGVTWDTDRTQASTANAALPRIVKRERHGLYLVTYQTNPGNQDLDLWSKTTRDPADWSAEAHPLSIETNTHDSQPIVLPDGTIAVFYARQAGQAFDLGYRTSTDGVAWSAEHRVTDDSARFDTQPHPVLAAEDGLLHLAWSHQVGDEPYSDHDVWFVRELLVSDPTYCVHLYLPLAHAGDALR